MFTEAANQHFRMISEGSCDTDDRSNEAKNQFCITGINYVLIYIYIKKLFEIVTIFHNITVCTVFFTQINASLVSISQWRKICFTPDRLESKVRSVLLCFALFQEILLSYGPDHHCHKHSFLFCQTYSQCLRSQLLRHPYPLLSVCGIKEVNVFIASSFFRCCFR